MFRATSRLRFIEPQLASLVDQPPEGRHWIHEIKHDGYRCIVIVERGGARVYTRNGYDWSDRYKSSRLTDVRWCHPKLRVRVKHLAGGKHLRHATVRAVEHKGVGFGRRPSYSHS